MSELQFCKARDATDMASRIRAIVDDMFDEKTQVTLGRRKVEGKWTKITDETINTIKRKKIFEDASHFTY